MPRSLPNLSGLQAFEATARLGSVSRAAEELRLTQSAVSRQLLGLEATLGISLFSRIRKRLILNEAGAAYLDAVRTHLAALDAATASLIAKRGRGGTLNLGTLPTFGAKWLIPRLSRFMQIHPGIKINMRSRLEPFDFAFDQLDAAIHFGGPDWPGAITEFLAHEEMAAVASPRLVAGLATPEDVINAPLVQISSRPFAWREWFEALGMTEPRLAPSLYVDTFAMAFEAARTGSFVAILPTFFVKEELSKGILGRIFNQKTMSSSAYYFVYPKLREFYYPITAFKLWLTSELGHE